MMFCVHFLKLLFSSLKEAAAFFPDFDT